MVLVAKIVNGIIAVKANANEMKEFGTQNLDLNFFNISYRIFKYSFEPLKLDFPLHYQQTTLSLPCNYEYWVVNR